MNRLVLSLIAAGGLLAGPALAQTMASPGAPGRAMAHGGMTAGSVSTPATARPGAAAASAAPVNVNTASEAQLDAIPQIGPKRAQAIIAHRPYTVPSDMVSKKALSQGIYNKVKARVTTS
jgi:competence protein ComEA